jgi:hypothetical protein
MRYSNIKVRKWGEGMELKGGEKYGCPRNQPHPP